MLYRFVMVGWYIFGSEKNDRKAIRLLYANMSSELVFVHFVYAPSAHLLTFIDLYTIFSGLEKRGRWLSLWKFT